MEKLFRRVKDASYTLSGVSDELVNAVLTDLAALAMERCEWILSENAKDLAKMDKDNPLYDRLMLTEKRLDGICSDMRKVATLPSPLGKVLDHRVLPNGLDLTRMSVAFGVIGIVYEARPNVTFDVFSLCLKAGSACILKGGKDADCSNRAIVSLAKEVLRRHGLDEHIIELLPATHEATGELLHANGYVDLVIPRGSRRLIDFVRQTASVPVIETGAGVCHAYFDENGNLDKGTRIILNAKTRRVSVCNALDCLLIHKGRLTDLPRLCCPMADYQVKIFADEPSYYILKGVYPDRLLNHIDSDNDYDTEYMDYAMGIKTVENMDDAMLHIRLHGSGHSECIISEKKETTERFLREVDAACVYSNAPTSFTDGGQFGMGAEIGISTQKLHARGPMALDEITTYKWMIRGDGQVRET